MQQDPVTAQEHWIKYSQMAQEHATAMRELDTAKAEKQSKMQQLQAKQRDDAYKVLKRDIPEWGPEYAAKLTKHAVTNLGFTDDELEAITDPRIVKMIDRDYQASKKVASAPKPKPVEPLKGTRKVKIDPSKLSDAEWFEMRRKEKERKR